MPHSLVATRVSTPIGTLLLEATATGLVGLSFVDDASGSAGAGAPDLPGGPASGGAVTSPEALERARWNLEQSVREVGEYLAGEREHFDVPIDWSRSNGFRRDVLRTLYEQVRFGDVVTYGELADLVGRPRAARAVGTAMATNPVAVVVPCHRVVRAGRVVGAYGGGVEAKQWLLELEGVL